MKTSFSRMARVVIACSVSVGAVAMPACKKATHAHDASGVFEARETVIAAEVAGQILQMPIEEGQPLAAQAIAAELDCSALQLQKAQAQASEGAIA